CMSLPAFSTLLPAWPIPRSASRPAFSIGPPGPESRLHAPSARTRERLISTVFMEAILLLDLDAGVLDHLRPLRRVVAHDLLKSRRRARIAAHAEIQEPLVERRLAHCLPRRVIQRLHHFRRQSRRRDEAEP